MKPVRFTLLCSLIVAFAGLVATACRGASAPTPRPTSTLISTTVAPPEAALTCANGDSTPLLDVQISASTFARWSMRWENGAPLSGDETIALRLNSSGNLAPNLYLVSENQRVSVPLSQFGLPEGALTIHLPLREVRDALGITPGFAVTPIADGLQQITQIDFTTSGEVLVSLQNGRVWGAFPLCGRA